MEAGVEEGEAEQQHVAGGKQPARGQQRSHGTGQGCPFHRHDPDLLVLYNSSTVVFLTGSGGGFFSGLLAG